MFSDDRGRLLAIHQPLRLCPFCGHNEQAIYETRRAWPRNGDAGRVIVGVVVRCRCGACLESLIEITEGDDEVKQIIYAMSHRWCRRADDC